MADENHRYRRTNFENRARTVADAYPNGLAHGLQKDAIQNSMDAQTQKPVIVEFKLVKTEKGQLFTITDSNTTGLKDDDWSRFEASDEPKDDPNARGSRGQGKFMMILSSEERKMFYDTKRIDNIYKLGGTQTNNAGDSRLFPDEGEVWEGGVACDELAERCGLTPLMECGTRLIIFSPRDEIVDAIKSSAFESAIQETWFRAIQKQQLQVFIDVDGERHEVTIGDDFIPDYEGIEEGNKQLKTWKLENEEIIAGGETYKIKRFYAIYDSREEVHEDLQGIAVVHYAMKILCLMGELPKEKIQYIKGYIEFDEKLDRELRKGENQVPSHYDLNLRRAIPKAINRYVREALDEFGREKLGTDPHRHERQEQSESDKRVMNEIQKLLKENGISLFETSKQGSQKKHDDTPVPSTPPLNKEIGLMFTDFQFSNPDMSPRVDWGGTVSFSLVAFNKTQNDVEGLVSLRVIHTGTGNERKTLMQRQPITILPRDTQHQIMGNQVTLDITEAMFPDKGKYTIKAEMIESDGTRIDRKSKEIWIEEDRSESGNLPFDIAGAPLEGRRAFQVEKEGGDTVLYYNTRHPEYHKVEKEAEERDLYVLKLCLEAIAILILDRSVDSADDEAYKPLSTEEIRIGLANHEPSRIYKEIIRLRDELLWQSFE